MFSDDGVNDAGIVIGRRELGVQRTRNRFSMWICEPQRAFAGSKRKVTFV